jgi:branched-chain amino acid transport system permease protein
MIRGKGRRGINYSKEMAILGNRQHWTALALFMVILIILPFILDYWTWNTAWLIFINETIIILIAVLGLNITSGMAGQVNLGHSAFVMTGGFTLAVLTTAAEWPMLAALPVATLFTGLVALVVAIPSIRLKGFYVAVVTMAFFYIAQFAITKFGITGGMHGLINISPPAIGSLVLKTSNHIGWFYFLIVLLILCIIVSVNIKRSRLGRSFTAVRDNYIAATSLGINVPLVKLRAFFIGGLYAGLAGGLLASSISVIRVDQFTFWESIWYLGMIIIGGAGSTAGAVMGVFFLGLIKEILYAIGSAGLILGKVSTPVFLTYILYGLIIILFVSFKPNGLISIWQKIKVNYKRWPFGV